MRELAAWKRFRPFRWAVGTLVLAVQGAVLVCAQPVQGEVRSVGFQAAVPSRFIIRHGQWFPILVELTGVGSEPHDVELRCEQEDLDGDRVAYVEPHVVVSGETGLKRVWCYAVALKEAAGQPMAIDVVGSDGKLVTSLPVPPAEPISNDTQLILDISEKRVTGLEVVNDDPSAYASPDWGNRRFYRTICVASLAARELPDRWYGLEAVDVIVWDEPDPGSLSIPQLSALVEWVRNGGQLVLGLGPAWMKVQRSALAEIMPLTGTGATAEVGQLDTLARRYALSRRARFQAPVSVAVGEPAQDSLVAFRDRLPGNRVVNLIAMKLVGSGRVIATAARLRDLAALNLSSDFYHELLDFTRNEDKFKQNEGKRFMYEVLGLYEELVARIEFQRGAGVRTLAAFAFVAAYILVSTFGAWAWLKRHTLTHVSWVAFAVFAIGASVLSLGAVGLSRGVTGAVQSVSFVDMEAGSSDARAMTYFGYKSNRRQRVDLSLPGEGSYLRPLATGRAAITPYATPERYQAAPGRATLVDTPMRATLKQFEGFWIGSFDGSIRGSLSADRRTGRLTPESWLQNDLDAAIAGGYLLYVDPRLRALDGGVPHHVAGLDTRNDRPEHQNKYFGSAKVPPAVNVLAVQIPALGPGQRLTQLGADEYKQYDAQYARWSIPARPDPKAEPMLDTLYRRQLEDWVGSLRATWPAGKLLKCDAAALLASTRNLYLHTGRLAEFDSVGLPVATAGLVDEDVTHWLVRGQAILLLLAGEPAPAHLHIDDKPKPAREGRTLYRVRIPIQYTGRPPQGTTG